LIFYINTFIYVGKYMKGKMPNPDVIFQEFTSKKRVRRESLLEEE